MIALARLSIPEMTAPLGASNIADRRREVDSIVETLAYRAERHNPDLLGETSEALRQSVRHQVVDLLDTWERIADRDQRLQYQKEANLAPPLLLDALDPEADKKQPDEQKFKTQRSLRDVEATVSVWIRDPYSMDVEEGGA